MTQEIRHCRLLFFVLALLGANFGLSSFAKGAQNSIVPHSAAYELKLVHAVSGSNIIGVEGFMSYDWSRRCDGWTNDQRLFLALNYGQNQMVRFKAVSITWESSDGTRFRFKINRNGMGQDDERIEGEAILEERGGAGEVLDGGVSLDAVLLAEILLLGAIHVSDEDRLGGLVLVSELVPSGLHRLAVASPVSSGRGRGTGRSARDSRSIDFRGSKKNEEATFGDRAPGGGIDGRRGSVTRGSVSAPIPRRGRDGTNDPPG